jgi:hypothetical protein
VEHHLLSEDGMKRTVLILAAALSLAACVEGEFDKGEEEEVPADGKLDSFARPTHHGELAFGDRPEATLTATERHHTWTFALTGEAAIHAFTGTSLTSRSTVDTVLYLYRQRADGSWGPYLARNDDANGTLYSALRRNLTAGTYRVLVKGYSASTRGRFSVQVDCEGAGCAAPSTCLFGATFGDLLDGVGGLITGDRAMVATDWLSPLDQARVVLAVQQSAHTDVTTVAEAFTRVDGNTIRRVDVYDEVGARSFVAFEYGAGDNSYGAVFGYGSTALVASIRDGDLTACTARAQTCALGTDWGTTRGDADFTRLGATVVTAAGQLSGADAAAATDAIRVAYADAADLADGLTRVDGGVLDVVDLRHEPTGTAIRAFTYGAGDNTYGALYQAGTTTRLASVVDGFYYDCSFAP